MDTDTDQPAHWTVTRLAREARVSRRTILRAIEDGTLPAAKLGAATNAWIIPAKAARRYLADHQPPPDNTA